MLEKILRIVVKFICLSIVLLVIFFVGEWLYWIFPCEDYEPSLLSYEYYKSEKYVNSDPFILFEKYYYSENPEKKEYKYHKYKLVKDNVETIKEYINTSLEKLHELDNTNNIEFNYDSITSNGYYLLKTFTDDNMVVLHYYDADEHILYVLYLPIEYADTIKS